MPIGYNKTPFTLQEKIDKAIKVTYQVHNAGDGEFLRKFLIELIEKAYTKRPPSMEMKGEIFVVTDHPNQDIIDKLNQLKQNEK